MEGARLVYEEHDRIGTLTLDAPPRNELRFALFDALAAFCSGQLPGLDLRGLIVLGRGRHFSSGANVEEMRNAVARDGTARFRQRLLANVESFLAIERLPYPVAAAVSGCCLGAGLELALACRMRIAAERAVFSLPEATFGLIPGCGGTVRLPRLVGRARAAELILSGRTFLADEALSLGIVDRVVPKAALLDTAREAVERGRIR